MIDHLSGLYRHMIWADARALESLRHANGTPSHALDVYAHFLGAEHVWLARLRQKPASVAVWPHLEVEGCARQAEANAREIGEFLVGLEEENLAREIPYTDSAGQPFRSTIEDILLHLFLHGTYHRGQVALLLRSDGAEPEPTD